MIFMIFIIFIITVYKYYCPLWLPPCDGATGTQTLLARYFARLRSNCFRNLSHRQLHRESSARDGRDSDVSALCRVLDGSTGVWETWTILLPVMLTTCTYFSHAGFGEMCNLFLKQNAEV